MRILGYAKHWSKLDKSVHTTFRLPRKDADKGRDWKVSEIVMEIVRPRASYASGKREIIGPAEIIAKEPRLLQSIDDDEAVADGFPGGISEMWGWMLKAHPHMDLRQTINKLTLRRVLSQPAGEGSRC